MSTTTDLLNLNGIGQRTDAFMFEVLDQNLYRQGILQPSADSPPSITNNSLAAIKRDLRGVILPPGTANDLNPLVHRLRVWHLLENGDQLPLGVFIFIDETRTPRSFGTTIGTELVDQGLILDDPISETFNLVPGDAVAAALAFHFEEAGIAPANYVIDPLSTYVGEPIGWPAGTSRLKVMNHLCSLASAYSVYFDNHGIGRVRAIQDLATTNPTASYYSGPMSNIVDGSILESNRLVSAYNRYRVVDSGATANPVVGTYDLPDSAPNSYANTGRRVTKTITKQGLSSSVEAVEIARTAAQQDALDYKWITFASPLNSLHDTYDVVEFLGVKYREQKWGPVSLRAGALMPHDLRGVYETTET